MSSFSNTGIILPAGGVGSRMQSDIPKQLLEIGAVPLFLHCIRTFQKTVPGAEIVLVCSEEDRAPYLKHLKEDEVLFAKPGPERWNSVNNGVNALSSHIEHVLIHDVARPFVSSAIISSCLDTLKSKGACIVAMPVADTVKKAKDGIIVETINRDEVFLAQTPQCFSYQLLQDCYKNKEQISFEPTDEASLVEFFGEQIHLVTGDFFNSKITTKQDFFLFEQLYSDAFLESRREKNG